MLATVAQIHTHHEKAELFPVTLAVALPLLGSLPCLTYLQRFLRSKQGRFETVFERRCVLTLISVLENFFSDFGL